MADDVYRIYEAAGSDGYPAEWHQTIKHQVREHAGHRCVRCHHPYQTGRHGNGEWTPCDEHCTHGMPARSPAHPFTSLSGDTRVGQLILEARLQGVDRPIEAQWRILTVHHLNGNKADCRWWNLCALCQRCHLTIQGRVQLHRVWPWEHSDWFKPYAAGWYAHAYLGLDLTRDETEARLDELLALERVA